MSRPDQRGAHTKEPCDGGCSKGVEYGSVCLLVLSCLLCSLTNKTAAGPLC